MDFRAIDRLMMPSHKDRDEDDDNDRRRLIQRHINERRNHQFSDDIGGCSANYVEPKFGPGPK